MTKTLRDLVLGVALAALAFGTAEAQNTPKGDAKTGLANFRKFGCCIDLHDIGARLFHNADGRTDRIVDTFLERSEGKIATDQSAFRAAADGFTHHQHLFQHRCACSTSGQSERYRSATTSSGTGCSAITLRSSRPPGTPAHAEHRFTHEVQP